MLAIKATHACDLSTVTLGSTTDSGGKLGPTAYQVHAVIHVANKPGRVRCGATGCAVSVGTLDGSSGGEHCISERREYHEERIISTRISDGVPLRFPSPYFEFSPDRLTLLDCPTSTRAA